MPKTKTPTWGRIAQALYGPTFDRVVSIDDLDEALSEWEGRESDALLIIAHMSYLQLRADGALAAQQAQLIQQNRTIISLLRQGVEAAEDVAEILQEGEDDSDEEEEEDPQVTVEEDPQEDEEEEEEEDPQEDGPASPNGAMLDHPMPPDNAA